MRIVTCLLALVLSAPRAYAQEDFSSLRIKRGAILTITDRDEGVTIRGPVSGVWPDRLRIGDEEFVPHSGLKIERDGDPVWDGALVGLGFGVLIGGMGGMPETCLQKTVAQCVWGSAASMTIMGAIIDSFHDGKTTIFAGSPGGSTADAFPPDFSKLKLRVGDKVFVTDAQGVEFSGRVTALTASELVVGARMFVPGPGLTVERDTNSIRNGVVLGGSIGLLISAGNQPVGTAAATSLALAGIGALIDWSAHSRALVYGGRSNSLTGLTRHVLPIVTSHERALAMSFKLR